MKTYKKIIVICLFFMLALSFCGCSGNEGKEKTNSGTSADGKGNKNGSVDEERKQEDGNSRMKVGQKGIENVKHGDVVIFGEYEQDNDTSNGKEPIEWIVLYADATNEKVLLLSKYGLDVKGYDDKVQAATTWETCSLRSWLNDEFYNTAFSSEDKSYVIKTLLKNPDNTTMLTEGGNDTEDNVFLLSLEESLNEQYGFVSNHEKDDMLKRCAPTDYAIAQGAYKNNFVKTDEEKPACLWWLRTPGGNQRQACYADYGGIVLLGGFNVDGDFASYNDDTGKEDDLGSYKDTHDIVVRPALYVKVENLKEDSSGNGGLKSGENDSKQNPEAKVIGSGYFGAEGNNLSWSLTDDGYLVISGSGEMKNDYEVPWDDFDDNITHVMIENGVTSFNPICLQYCYYLVSVSFSETIENIMPIFKWANQDRYLFLDCPHLKDILVAENNQYYTSVNGVLFDKDMTTLIRMPEGYSEKEFDIPDSVKKIEKYALKNCSIPDVKLGSSIEVIGDYSFEYCNGITEIVLPDTVSNIGKYAFCGCDSIKNVIIDGNVVDMGKGIFSSNDALETVRIKNGVTYITTDAFSSCDSLKTIYIPSTVTVIYADAFSDCPEINDVYYGGDNTDIDIPRVNASGNPVNIHLNSSETE